MYKLCIYIRSSEIRGNENIKSTPATRPPRALKSPAASSPWRNIMLRISVRERDSLIKNNPMAMIFLYGDQETLQIACLLNDRRWILETKYCVKRGANESRYLIGQIVCGKVGRTNSVMVLICIMVSVVKKGVGGWADDHKGYMEMCLV